MVPRFLCAPQRVRPEKCKKGLNHGAPIRIVDFDPQEDILSLVFEPEYPLPDLSIKVDEENAVTTLLADGKPVVILHGAGPGFSLRNVAVTCYMG